MKVGDLVKVKRCFPASLVFGDWVGIITKTYWPYDGLKYVEVCDTNDKIYCREVGCLGIISPLEALALQESNASFLPG